MRRDSGKFACHHRRVRRSAGGKDEKVPKISLQQRNKAAAAERQGDRNNFVNSIRCDYSRSPYLSPPPCPVPASSADSKDVSVAACRQSCRTRATRLLHFGSSRHHHPRTLATLALVKGSEIRCRQSRSCLFAIRIYEHRDYPDPPPISSLLPLSRTTSSSLPTQSNSFTYISRPPFLLQTLKDPSKASINMVAIKSFVLAAATTLVSFTTAAPTWTGTSSSLTSIVNDLVCPKGSVLFKAHNEGIVPVSAISIDASSTSFANQS